MDYEALALQYGAKPTGQQDLAALAARFGARPSTVSPSQAVDEAQTNPEADVFGMRVQGETDSGFSPAAAIIGTGRLGDKLNQGYQQAKSAANFAVGRLNDDTGGPCSPGSSTRMDTGGNNLCGN